MPNWTITATTIYCEAVDDEVTILVHGDRTFRCVAHSKYGQPAKEVAGVLKRKGKRLKRELKCEGATCCRAQQYRDRLMQEEDPTPKQPGDGN